MESELAKQILEKQRKRREYKNAHEKARRLALGDNWKEQNKANQKRFQDKERKAEEEAREALGIKVKKGRPSNNIEKEVNEIKEDESEIIVSKPKEKKEAKEVFIVNNSKDRKLVSNVDKTGVKYVADTSRKNYISSLNVIHKLFKEEKLDKELLEILEKVFTGKATKGEEDKLIERMDYVKDVDKLTKEIFKKYENLNSRKFHLNSVLTLTTYIDCLKMVNYEKIRTIYDKLVKDVYDIREKNEIKENTKIEDFGEEAIIEILNSKMMRSEGAEGRLIYGMYSLMPPRRRSDVYDLFIKDNEDNLEDKKNYIVINGDEIKLFYNDAKSKKSLGKQEITITNDVLKNLIREHIKISKRKEGDRLWSQQTANGFGRRVKTIFTKIYGKQEGKDITINTIRHNYITYYLDVIKPNVADAKLVANMMGHSKQEQDLYKWRENNIK
jgi:hypothetical protein